MKKNFSQILQQIFKDLGLRQKDFAAKLGTAQSTVSRWLSGEQEPKFTILQHMCIVFDIDPSEILGLD